MHTPVLLTECIEALKFRQNGVYIDGTLGRAGHAVELAKRLETGRLIGIDRDAEAIQASSKRLAEYGSRVTLVQGNFRDLGNILDRLGLKQVDGMLFDLGVSSPQLDVAERGFSYMTENAPLDMRMDAQSELCAKQVVNQWTEEEIRRILFEYGEERYARRIANAIVRAREEAPIETTGDLVNLIKQAIPAPARREKQHPAKRSFQSIRIAVNDELGALEEMLKTAINYLAPRGRLVVICFHSLEERLVKKAIRAAEDGCICPSDFPICTCGFTPTVRSINKKAITATKEEIEKNPRARSAKLRIAEKI